MLDTANTTTTTITTTTATKTFPGMVAGTSAKVPADIKPLHAVDAVR